MLFEVKMLRWRELEKSACDAEIHLEQLGQASASPEAAALVTRAKQLREEADLLFREILAMVPRH